MDESQSITQTSRIVFTATWVVYPLSTFDIHKWKKVISTQANFTFLSVFWASKVRKKKIQEKHPHMLTRFLRKLARKNVIDFLSGFLTYKDRLVFNAESSTSRRANTLGVSLSHEAWKWNVISINKGAWASKMNRSMIFYFHSGTGLHPSVPVHVLRIFPETNQ